MQPAILKYPRSGAINDNDKVIVEAFLEVS